jgi:hypothetical protein
MSPLSPEQGRCMSEEMVIRRHFPRVVCPICGVNVVGFVPKGGDGSVLRVRAHQRYGQQCQGAGHLVTDGAGSGDDE